MALRTSPRTIRQAERRSRSLLLQLRVKGDDHAHDIAQDNETHREQTQRHPYKSQRSGGVSAVRGAGLFPDPGRHVGGGHRQLLPDDHRHFRLLLLSASVSGRRRSADLQAAATPLGSGQFPRSCGNCERERR